MSGERLGRNALDRARHGFADRIIDYAVEERHGRVPDILVDEEVEVMHDELRGALPARGSRRRPTSRRPTRRRNELHADFRPGAEERAKTLLVLGKIAEDEGIEVTDADVDAEAADARQRYASDPKLAEYFDTPRARGAIRSSLRRSRVVEKLIDDWLAAHPEHPAIPHIEDASAAAGAAAAEEASSSRS